MSGQPVPIRDRATEALAAFLLLWYRLRYALPAPLGRQGLIRSALLGWPRPREVGRGPGGVTGPRAARVESLFGRAVRRVPAGGGTCVPRSLALLRLLRLHGLDAELRVGMRRSGEGFAGHAWVVHHGGVIGQQVDVVAGFAPLRLGSAPAPANVGTAP